MSAFNDVTYLDNNGLQHLKDRLHNTFYVTAGRNASATLGIGATAEGYNVRAIGNYSHAEGNATYAAQYSHAEGSSSQASGYASHAEGCDTLTMGSYSHAEGFSAYANGEYSHAEGGNSHADGDASHVEGYNTYAIGAVSHAEGHSSHADGSYSHSEGFKAHAGGSASHSEGYNTYAFSNSSHAEGYQTFASGSYSHAEGYMTNANKDYSHAAGLYTIANSEAATVVGKYSNDAQDILFGVGNGTGTSARSSCFEITTDGFIRTGATKIRFGVDANGNYGYIKPGADTVYPFKNPQGEQSITSNGVYNIEDFASVNVQVPVTVHTSTFRPVPNNAAKDMGSQHSYRYVNTLGYLNSNGGTNSFTATANGTYSLSSAKNSESFYGATTVIVSVPPTTHTGTFRPSPNVSAADMGAQHTNRYVNTLGYFKNGGGTKEIYIPSNGWYNYSTLFNGNTIYDSFNINAAVDGQSEFDLIYYSQYVTVNGGKCYNFTYGFSKGNNLSTSIRSNNVYWSNPIKTEKYFSVKDNYLIVNKNGNYSIFFQLNYYRYNPSSTFYTRLFIFDNETKISSPYSESNLVNNARNTFNLSSSTNYLCGVYDKYLSKDNCILLSSLAGYSLSSVTWSLFIMYHV